MSEPETGCGQSADTVRPAYTGSATWVFDTWPDEASGIRFDYRGAGTGTTCSVYLSVLPDERGFLPHDPGPWYGRVARTGG